MNYKRFKRGTGSNRPRRPSSRYITTRSGKVLKVNRSLGEKWTALKEGAARRKAERLRGLPKSRLKRLVWRLHPKRLAAYWFSRDGGIMALKVGGIAILVFFVLTLGVFAYFRKDLPQIKEDISGSNLGGSISYYDRTGQHLLWQDYDAVKRVPVDNDKISKYIKDATVAIEDRDFYQHRGFDIRGIARAAINDLMHRSTRQGGSTITQQLVKLTQDWTQQRSFARKVKEIILAVELERSYTKEDILRAYLNAAPYGGVDYGVQAAAQDYFHKDAKDLTLDEAAMMAAIPKSPAIYSKYSPDFDQEAFTARYNYVLDSMVQTRKIKREEAEAAKKVDIIAKIHPQQAKYAGIKHPYFLLAAKNELLTTRIPAGSGSKKVGGWRVTTTLDLNLQALAEAQVQKGLAQVKRQGGDVATIAAEDVKSGQMVALVGGVDFNNEEYGKINYAQWPVSPGSSFKPYDYISLMENTNAGAGSVLYDTLGPLPGYPCTNKARQKDGGNCLQDYDFRAPGPLTIRYSLGGSRNIPAVKAFLIAGGDKTRTMAKSMMGSGGYGYNCFEDQKLTKPGPCYGSAAIGDGAYLHLDEHTHGFATISRNGIYIPQTYILKINDASNKTLYEWKQDKKQEKQVIKEDSAYIVGNILSDPNASYFPSGQKIHRYKGWNFGLKTGTTNDAKDGLLMGFSTKYAVGVWVGYHTRQKAMSGFMENMTRPIWNGFMTGAHANLQPENWKQPSSVKNHPAYVVRTHVGVGSVEPSPATEIYPALYKPKGNSNQNSTIDKVSNKLATDCTPALARENVSGSSNADQFSVDTFAGAGAREGGDSSATDDVHSCSDGRPSVASFFINGQDVSGGGTVNCSGSCAITATVTQGTHPLSDAGRAQFPGTVNLLVNGQVAQSKQVSDSPSTVSFDYPGSGSAVISIQVIDSVLYDSTSASATVNFSQANPLSFNSAKREDGKTKFNWSGGVGPYSVFNRDNQLMIYCVNINDTKCEYPSQLPVGTPVRVKDSTGSTADTTVSN